MFRSNSKSPLPGKILLKFKVSSTGEFSLKIKVPSTRCKREILKSLQYRGKMKNSKVSSTGET
eukprot:UN23486